MYFLSRKTGFQEARRAVLTTTGAIILDFWRSFIDDGGIGDDPFNGLKGGDTLEGGTGNDIVIGGLRADSLSSGDDRDTASYGIATGGVTVSAFALENFASRLPVAPAVSGTMSTVMVFRTSRSWRAGSFLTGRDQTRIMSELLYPMTFCRRRLKSAVSSSFRPIIRWDRRKDRLVGVELESAFGLNIRYCP